MRKSTSFLRVRQVLGASCRPPHLQASLTPVGCDRAELTRAMVKEIRPRDYAIPIIPRAISFAQDDGAIARLSRLAKTGGCVWQKRVVLAPVAGVKSAENLQARQAFPAPSLLLARNFLSRPGRFAPRIGKLCLQFVEW